MSQILVINKNNRYISATVDDFDIKELNISTTGKEDISFNLGDIIVGRVENVVKNISSCFVEIFPGIKAYLALSEKMPLIYTNGKQGGMPVQNDLILVQIKKEPTKTKSYFLTTDITLMNRYVVLKPFMDKVHISKKFDNSKTVTGADKKALLDVAGEFKNTTGCGSIIRTNAAGVSADRIKSSLEELYATYIKAVNLGVHGVKYQRVYKDIPDYLIPLRDGYEDIEKIQTDDKDAYAEIQEYLAENDPESLDKLFLYEDEMIGLDALYSISTTIEKALKTNVWLKSGGYIVIEMTEAMTVIDVNSGGAIKGKNSSEETFLKVNKEACVTIAKELRLRNISGIIIVDFIDMPKYMEEELIRTMQEELNHDSTQSTVIDMTGLGLMEITRRRTGKPLHEALK